MLYGVVERGQTGECALDVGAGSGALSILQLVLKSLHTLVADVREEQKRREQAADKTPHMRLM